MYRYRYIHTVPVAFTELVLKPNLGDEIKSKTTINHPYWELIEDTKAPEVPAVIEVIESEKPTDGVNEIESPVAADTVTKES